MRKLSVLLLISLMSLTVSGALPDSGDLDQLKNEYNNQSSEVPGFVGSIIGDERVEFTVETNSSNVTYGVVFEGIRIENISQGELEDETIKANTDQQTVTAILQSDKKYSTLKEKLDENEIEYSTETLGAGLKLTVFSTLGDLASMIGLSF